MSTPTQRRHSPAVYRRRRVVVFGGLAVIILAIALLIWQPWNASSTPAKPSSSTSPSATPSAAAGETGDGTTEGEAAPSDVPVEELPTEQPEAEVVACGPQDVRVDASTDKAEYGADELPQLTLSLTNLTDRDCTIDVGTAVQTFTITSGNDVWWRSTDCQANPTTQIVTLGAGQTAASQTPLVWDRTRSSVSTCADETRPRAGGGGASYHLAVTIGSFESQGSAQFMLY